MKPISKIEELLEVADSINYHEKQLNRRKKESERYFSEGIMTDTDWFERANKIYERLLRILELKYQRILKQINDEE